MQIVYDNQIEALKDKLKKLNYQTNLMAIALIIESIIVISLAI